MKYISYLKQKKCYLQPLAECFITGLIGRGGIQFIANCELTARYRTLHELDFTKTKKLLLLDPAVLFAKLFVLSAKHFTENHKLLINKTCKGFFVRVFYVIFAFGLRENPASGIILDK